MKSKLSYILKKICTQFIDEKSHFNPKFAMKAFIKQLKHALKDKSFYTFCIQNTNVIFAFFMPRVFNIPKVEHDQPCSTLVVLFFQISLFIYVILGPDWPRAKIKVNKKLVWKN